MSNVGRPKKNIKRIEKVTVRFSKQELIEIENLSKKLQISRTEFIRLSVHDRLINFNFSH